MTEAGVEWEDVVSKIGTLPAPELAAISPN
jgi:hypothetical protein